MIICMFVLLFDTCSVTPSAFPAFPIVTRLILICFSGYACCMALDVTKAEDMWLDLLPRSKKDKKITGKIHIRVVP